MRILLGNTGRGGEQCIFSSFVHAFRQQYPSAYIEVAVCPEFAQLWKHHHDVDYITELHHGPTSGHHNDPVGRFYSHAERVRSQFDIVDFACEYNLGQERTTFEHIRSRLSTVPESIEKRVYFTPTDQEWQRAFDILGKYGSDFVLVSHMSNSAMPVLPMCGYQDLVDEIGKTHRVAFTGRLNKADANGVDRPISDPFLHNAIDLRGIPFMVLYALAHRLRWFVGPDTATTWMATVMPGRLVSLRGDRFFTIANTGLISHGYREEQNTLEFDVIGKSMSEVIGTCRNFLFN